MCGRCFAVSHFSCRRRNLSVILTGQIEASAFLPHSDCDQSVVFLNAIHDGDLVI
jgi:hypothetical protein